VDVGEPDVKLLVNCDMQVVMASPQLRQYLVDGSIDLPCPAWLKRLTFANLNRWTWVNWRWVMLSAKC
jgi:hypothetical protein